MKGEYFNVANSGHGSGNHVVSFILRQSLFLDIKLISFPRNYKGAFFSPVFKIKFHQHILSNYMPELWHFKYD